MHVTQGDHSVASVTELPTLSKYSTMACQCLINDKTDVYINFTVYQALTSHQRSA